MSATPRLSARTQAPSPSRSLISRRSPGSVRAWRATAVALLLVASAVYGQGKPGSVTITTTAPLSFGSLTGAGGGSVTIAPDGTRTASGVFPLGGAFGPASFTVTTTQGNPHYMITLPATATLT